MPEMIKYETVGNILKAKDIKSMVELMMENTIPPKKVKSIRQAKRMTKHDPIGLQWRKGDKYYRLLCQEHQIPINLSGMTSNASR